MDGRKIVDPHEFYRNRFVFERSFDFTRHPINYYDIENFKALWMFSHITPGTRVLDFGCGSGRLACLKRKNCYLGGIDLSRTALEVAQKINGYDEVFHGELDQYCPKEPFDYVVSLDVFGHIPFARKDSVIAGLKRLLKPGGMMLHGVECGNLAYETMTEDEYERIVLTDGHEGIENKAEITARFRRFFKYVSAEVRFDVVAAHSDYLKYEREYPGSLAPHLVAYLNCLGPAEIRAFNVANGLTLIKMHEQQYPFPDQAEGFLFLRAADQPIPSVALSEPRSTMGNDGGVPNWVADDRFFLHGWYPAEPCEDGWFRWAQRRAQLLIIDQSDKTLTLRLFTRYPKIEQKPMELYFFDQTDNRLITTLVLDSIDDRSVSIPVSSGFHVIDIFSDLGWIPSRLDRTPDHRELSFALHHLSID